MVQHENNDTPLRFISQNMVYIYRGKEFERLTDFTARLVNQFPNAVVSIGILYSCNIRHINTIY